ncbi:MAG: hypothetical protein KBE04_05970 [Phycisphaerae bacterium]|nr:hypothetical protein [Phycisphaerae bacterium]
MDTNQGPVRIDKSGGVRPLKSLHIVSTVWFVVCLVYLLVMALREAGFRWWVIFSLSGYSVVPVLVLLSLYLFALFRGVRHSQQIQVEHPLTCSEHYMVLYAAAPFLGGAAGFLSGLGLDSRIDLLHRMTLGAFITTFLVWVILDPVVAVLEGLWPASRRNRAERLARQEAQRREREVRREQVLAQVLETEQTHRRLWQQALEPHAQELSGLLATDASGFQMAQTRAVEIGAEAWRLGGIGCMRQLHEMAVSRGTLQSPGRHVVDYLPYWWDGIGTWRGPNS